MRNSDKHTRAKHSNTGVKPQAATLPSPIIATLNKLFNCRTAPQIMDDLTWLCGFLDDSSDVLPQEKKQMRSVKDMLCQSLCELQLLTLKQQQP